MARLLAGLMMLLVAVATLGGHPAGALEARERALIGAINAERVARGLSTLRYEPRLARVARDFARASATGAAKADPALDVSARLADNAYPFLAIRAFAHGGTLDAAAQVKAWLAEGDRRLPLLDREFVEIGVGHLTPAQAGQNAAGARLPPHIWGVVLATPTGPATLGWGARVLTHVNAFRSDYGLIPLSRNRTLDRAAQAHADDMARRDFFAHQTPEGVGPAKRVDRVGYHWSRVLENLAAGQPTPREVVDGWINSKTGHREAMLDKAVREIGVGYTYLPRDGGRVAAHHYWAMTLAAPR